MMRRDRARGRIVAGLERVDDPAGAGPQLRDRAGKDDSAGAKNRDGVAQILEETATGSGAWNAGTGYGVLDVASAVARALGVNPPPRR